MQSRQPKPPKIPPKSSAPPASSRWSGRGSGLPPILYHVDFETVTLKDFAPPSQAGEVLLWKILAGAGTAAGVLVGHWLR